MAGRRAEIILSVTPEVGSLRAAFDAEAARFGRQLQSEVKKASSAVGSGGGTGIGSMRTATDGGTAQAKIDRDRAAASRIYWQMEFDGASRVHRLRMQQARELEAAQGPLHRQAISAQYAQRIKAAQAPPSFAANFTAGWNQGGGFATALGTMVKFGATYKLIDMAATAAFAPITAVSGAVRQGVQDWFDYEEQMANASRTMREFGMDRGVISDVLGADALDFITRYRTVLQDAAKAQYELGSANLNAGTTYSTYQVPLKVNIGLIGDITQTTRLMTQMYKIHEQQLGRNLSAEEKMTRIGGILLKTWELEQVELSDIAQAYKYVAANAATMKISAEELIPTIGFLSTYGMRGSTAGTGLNQFLMQSAKNMKLTKDQAIELQKATQGVSHKFQLGIKADELVSPLQLFIQMAKAVQSMPDNLAGRMKVAGIFGDVFNIRGARPAALLADLERAGDLLQNVGDVSRMATADMERYIDSMVELRQNTPTAQLEIMRNVTYALGVDFTRAAVGGDSFVETLKHINSMLRTMQDIAPIAGGTVNIMARGVAGAISGYSEGRKQGFDDMFGPFASGIVGGVQGLLTGMDKASDQVAEDRIAAQVSKSYFDIRKAGQGPEAARDLAKRVAQVGGMGMLQFNALMPKIEQRYQAESQLNIGNPNANPPAYVPSPTGGGNSSAAKKTPQEVADQAAREAMQGWENKLALGMMTRDVVEQRLMTLWQRRDPAWRNVSIDTRAQAKSRLDRIQQEREQDVEKARRDAIQKAGNQSEIELRNQDQALRFYTDRLTEAEQALKNLEATEKIHGQTLDFNARKITTLSAQEKDLLRAREIAEGNLQSAEYRYGALLDVWQTLSRPGATLAADQQDVAKGFIGTSTPTFEEANQALRAAESQVDRVRGQVREFTSQLQEARVSMAELERSSDGMMLDRRLDMIGRSADATRAEFEALGKDWTTSAESLRYLNEQIGIHEQKRRILAARLQSRQITGDEYSRQLLEELNAEKLLRADIAGGSLAASNFTDDYGLRIRDTRRSWMRGSPADMARNQIAGSMDAIDLEIGRLRRQYSGVWAQDTIDAYEQTMRADAIARPWLEARDRVESGFIDAFNSIFAQAQEGPVDLADASKSVIGGIQSQMISGWVRKNLGGVFDLMATKELGYSPIDPSAQASAMALDTLTLQARLAAQALGGIGTGVNLGTVARLSGGIPQFGAGATGLDWRLGFVGAGVGVGLSSVDGLSKQVADGMVEASGRLQATATGGKSRGLGRDLATGLQSYSVGSMFAGPIGGMLGFEQESASVAGGLGYAAGMALGWNPVAAGLLGIASIFGFGRKKKKPQAPPPEPRRDTYGMSAYEWESYLYAFYQSSKQLSPYSLGSDTGTRLSEGAASVNLTNNSSVGTVELHIHGGDLRQVYATVQKALKGQVGPMAQVTAAAELSI